MSWVVESYIINSSVIKSSYDFDSDTFIDLLLIEKTFNDLVNNRTITPLEASVVVLMSNGGTFLDVGKNLRISRILASKIFSRACEKIASSLGDYFSDVGYLSYIKNKYNLTDAVMEEIWLYIRSKKRHQLKRNKFIQENNGRH